MLKIWSLFFAVISILPVCPAREYHVSVKGNDADSGSALKPFKTISAAVKVAQPGDVVTVHEGTYREYINPLRGGTSDSRRITYQAAKGQKVIIKGSEIITGWQRVRNDTWKTSMPNSFFGDFNPYNDVINGDWFKAKGRKHHTGAVYLNENWFFEAAELEDVLKPVEKHPLWFAQVDKKNTTIWAQFKNVNPNESDVEINVRQTLFYPKQTGVNYITVRGFIMKHAATPWAPPTAEQIGLIGTNWSRGWIIEDNDISYSMCVGIALGKYGDKWDNQSQNSAGGYVKTIQRALKNGWSKENIGHHIVRNNKISHCEQAGIVGSLGGIFSKITGNTVHDIHVRKLFSGHEQAGIKIHAPIDMLIKDNYIHHCTRGLWLDWMAQGVRVTSNLFHDNFDRDLYVEVSHGPYVIDNNIFLSKITLVDWSRGGCYAHNLIAGKISFGLQKRITPYQKPHSTQIGGLSDGSAGDNRFYNNIFIGGNGIESYKKAELPVFVDGNVYLNGSRPYPDEINNTVISDYDPEAKLVRKNGSVCLHLTWPAKEFDLKTQLVTTDLLGEAAVPLLPFKNYDGMYLKVDCDYFGNKRNILKPSAGPFEKFQSDQTVFKLK